MDKYECQKCDYVYDEAKGELGLSIKKGTTFDKVPEYFLCPVCGAPKAQFVKL